MLMSRDLRIDGNSEEGKNEDVEGIVGGQEIGQRVNVVEDRGHGVARLCSVEAQCWLRIEHGYCLKVQSSGMIYPPKCPEAGTFDLDERRRLASKRLTIMALTEPFSSGSITILDHNPETWKV